MTERHNITPEMVAAKAQLIDRFEASVRRLFEAILTAEPHARRPLTDVLTNALEAIAMIRDSESVPSVERSAALADMHDTLMDVAISLARVKASSRT